MDLLATVRKEGSRGGRGDFQWSDVQSSSHRENYLGHSLMAPVGRWQKGRDLSWYAKGDKDEVDGEDPAAEAARERKEEIRRVKEAEEDALARALGLPVAPRNNPNMEELGGQREVGRVLKEAADDSEAAATRGVGYGRLAGVSKSDIQLPATEQIDGTSNLQDRELQYALKEYERRHGAEENDDRRRRRRSRSHSRDRNHDKEHRRRRRDGHRHRQRHEETHRAQRSKERSLPQEKPERRSQSPLNDRPGASRHREKRRSRSPRNGYHQDKRSHHDDRRHYDRR